MMHEVISLASPTSDCRTSPLRQSGSPVVAAPPQRLEPQRAIFRASEQPAKQKKRSIFMASQPSFGCRFGSQRGADEGAKHLRPSEPKRWQPL